MARHADDVRAAYEIASGEHQRVAWGRHHHPLTCSVVTMTGPSGPKRNGEQNRSLSLTIYYILASVHKFINI